LLKHSKIKKSKKPTIVYLGRWKNYKRIDLLLEAFKIVKKRVKNVELWLAGDDKLKVKGNGIKNFGKINEKMKKKILSEAWVFVNPSMKEGWSITVIEANACGTPAIAYDVPGLRDSIVDGKTGLLVKENGNVEKLAEAIIKVLEDEKLRKKLSKNALEYSKRFSWDKSAEEFLKVLEGVVNEG
jgi:glycosyltransferase involved in cell wall biosynthesis